ncbi:hypothetical protein DLJ53_21095 [Acuticoccus sediminis]|uniref:Uncharacterized protein n=1 Tax=Acuticoccus sediminis TaxID=2184697 RepID=A0A8B2NKR8_9HYPH|nr:DUF6494 family protein [Acuticoccus sediminis]RAI00205.1 hypothetical protein DLJ53_21095 [Acuticoccus sediminis]
MTDTTPDAFNMSLRKFLKTVGVTSQREIEEAVRAAREAGALPAGPVSAKVTLTVESLGLTHEVDGSIDMPADGR